MSVFLMSHIHYHWLNSWPFRVYCFVQWSVFNFIKTGLWEQGGAQCQNQWDQKRWFNLKFVWSLLMIIRFFMITFIMFQTGMMFGCSRPLVPAFPQVSTLSTASSFTSSALWSLGLPTSFWHHCQPHDHHQCQCHHQSQCHHPCSKEYDPPHQQKTHRWRSWSSKTQPATSTTLSAWTLTISEVTWKHLKAGLSWILKRKNIPMNIF